MEQNLWELRENCHMEETLCKKREELRARRKQLEEKMLELSVEHRREVQDVKDLEGLTMTSILSSLSGTKQKNLEKEQKEAEEAALRLEEAKRGSGAGGKRIAVCGSSGAAAPRQQRKI